MMTFSGKSNTAFISFISLFVGLFSALVYFIISLTPDVVMFLRYVFTGSSAFGCACADFLNFSTHPFFHSFLLLTYCTAIVFCGAFLYVLIHNITALYTTHTFIKSHLMETDADMEYMFLTLNISEKVRYIHSDSLYIFCFGIYKPVIVVSSAAAKALNVSEFEAALLHEKHHLHSYDSLRLFFILLFESLFFWIPGFRYISHQCKTYIELAADEYVLNHSITKRSLGSAIVTFLDRGAYIAAPVAHLAHNVEVRLKWLLQNQKPRTHLAPRAFGFLTAVMLLSGILFFSKGYEVLAVFENSDSESSMAQCPVLHAMSVGHESMTHKPVDSCINP